MIKIFLSLLLSTSVFAQQNGWEDIPPSGGGTGTVTSVGLALPNIFNVTGSPVTTTGTLTGTFVNQSANTIFAGPSSGPAAVPAFRALVNADIPYVFSAPLINTAGTISITQSGAASNGYLSSVDWNIFNNKQPAGSYITALTGDGTAAGPGSVPFTLATVNGNVGSFGTVSSVGSFTVNGKGLITAASNTSIQIAESQVTNLVSDLAGKQGTVSIGALDAQAANANGLALVANVLSTQSADVTHPGMINNTVQSFSGNKIFTGTISASNLSGTNTGDQTITLTGDVTGSGTGSFAATISNLAVTNAKIANATIDLTSKVTGVLPIANGGTNNGALAVTAGGTLYTDGSKIVNVGVGTSGQILTSNGAGPPTWNTPATSGGTLCDLSVGPAQTYTTISAAITAASAGQSICIQSGTYAESLSVAKQLNIHGSGRGVDVTGSLTVASGGDYSLIEHIKVESGITINSGLTGVQLVSLWSAAGQTVSDLGSGDYLLVIQE